MISRSTRATNNTKRIEAKMTQALGLIEFTSISCGIDVCDEMLKAANTELLRAGTICPGKYMVLLSGETGDVRQALAAAVATEERHIMAHYCLPNCHREILAVLRRRRRVKLKAEGALGMFEYSRVITSIAAADAALKAAQVQLLELRTGFGIGGKGFFLLSGSVGDVRAAAEACLLLPNQISCRVIPKPDSQILEYL